MTKKIKKSNSLNIIYKKKSIPKSLKKAVWVKHHGENFTVSCPCCNLNKIDPFNFHTAHIKAEKEGGKTNIDNLIPTCASCNLSMGTKNYYDFKNQYHADKSHGCSIQ